MQETQSLKKAALSGQKAYPQVKICGLTRVDEAVACIEAGADAVGCVFYPPSPRYVTEDQARDIVRALPSLAWVVGVFVDDAYSSIMAIVEKCRLKAVQLHGREPPRLVESLRRQGLTVIKALFHKGMPPISHATLYRPSAFLVECAGGVLPGGNAMAWDWGVARGITNGRPLLLAGGLNPVNVAAAVRQSAPDGVDVSSGVESGPGRKDLEKVKRFIEEIRAIPPSGEIQRIFP